MGLLLPYSLRFIVMESKINNIFNKQTENVLTVHQRTMKIGSPFSLKISKEKGHWQK